MKNLFVNKNTKTIEKKKQEFNVGFFFFICP